MLVMMLFILFVEEVECVLVGLLEIFTRLFFVPGSQTVNQSSREADQEVGSTSLLDVRINVFNDFCVGCIGCDLDHEYILRRIGGHGNGKRKEPGSHHKSLAQHHHSANYFFE
jgi:hypothetical protein